MRSHLLCDEPSNKEWDISALFNPFSNELYLVNIGTIRMPERGILNICLGRNLWANFLKRFLWGLPPVEGKHACLQVMASDRVEPQLVIADTSFSSRVLIEFNGELCCLGKSAEPTPSALTILRPNSCIYFTGNRFSLEDAYGPVRYVVR